MYNSTGQVTDPILTFNTSYILRFLLPGTQYRVVVYSITNSTRSLNPTPFDITTGNFFYKLVHTPQYIRQ